MLTVCDFVSTIRCVPAHAKSSPCSQKLRNKLRYTYFRNQCASTESANVPEKRSMEIQEEDPSQRVPNVVTSQGLHPQTVSSRPYVFLPSSTVVQLQPSLPTLPGSVDTMDNNNNNPGESVGHQFRAILYPPSNIFHTLRQEQQCLNDLMDQFVSQVQLGTYGCNITTVRKHILSHIPGGCLLYTSPSPRDLSTSRMPSSA